MRIRGVNISVMSIVCLGLYYGIAQFLPASYSIGGGISLKIRRLLCKYIFKSMGDNVNVERRANFGSGRNIVIGNNSGIGQNSNIPSNTVIGNDVMMGPNCFIIRYNHAYERTDIPIAQQGYQSAENELTIIEDDVWIGMNVLMTPGRHIKKGSLIAAGTVLCKDFPEYSVIGGNPSKLIKNRVDR